MWIVFWTKYVLLSSQGWLTLMIPDLPGEPTGERYVVDTREVASSNQYN